MLRHFPCLMKQWISLLFTFGSQSPEVFAMKIIAWCLGERSGESFWNVSSSKIAPWRSISDYQGSELWQGKNYTSTNIHVFCNCVIWNCSNPLALKHMKTHGEKYIWLQTYRHFFNGKFWFSGYLSLEKIRKLERAVSEPNFGFDFSLYNS